MILLLYTSKNTFLELGIFDWIRNKETKTEFEKTFADLNRMSSIVPSGGKTFDLLKSLNSETTES